ncbi:MAG: hypothetical protein KJO18_02605 [Acidimicrobiia bacterium]|nr:hypothetical protein [Acidimicrobiia bacterium]
MRKQIVVLAAVLSLAAGATPSVAHGAFAAPVRARAAALQTDVSQFDFLRMGDVIQVGDWQLTIPSSITGPSLTETGWTEVRAAVTMVNTGTDPVKFDYAPFVDDGTYPTFAIRDARGNLWPIKRTSPLEGTMPTTNLHQVLPSLTARWTIGFQVPSINDDALELEVYLNGLVVGSYDLLSTPTVAAWPAPNMPRTRVGAPIEWAPGVTASANAISSRVCGNPEIETVTQIVAVTLDVENENSADFFWPGVDLPTNLAIAQWSDGTAARFSLESYVDSTFEPLERYSGKWVVLPPGAEVTRTFIFATARDARLGLHDDFPDGIYLQRPDFDGFDADGIPATVSVEPLWLDLEGASTDLEIPATFCDLGFGPEPVQYAYSPVAKYAVGGEALPADKALVAKRARKLMTEALAAASLYYDLRGSTFVGADVEDIEALALGVPMVRRSALDPPTAAVGTVFVDFDPLDPRFIYLLTQASNGDWYCTGTAGFVAQLSAVGNVDEIPQTCFVNAFLVDTTATTTTTTTAAP